MNSGSLLIAVGFAVSELFLLLGLLRFRHWSANRGNKLPLTKRYLRPPGETLRLELEKLDESISDTLLWIVVSSVVLGFGVYALLTDSAILGVIFIGLALAAMIYLALRFEKEATLRRDHYLGFLGERVVGEELNQLMSNGWSVFHDVRFDDNPAAKPFNVDHVVCRTGWPFAIETKTRHKRKESGGHEVTLNGQTLEYPWGSEDWGVTQAQQRAHHLSQWLTKRLQTDITVAPVLVLTGWYVHRTGKSDLTVINEGEVPSLFHGEHKAGRLRPETVAAICALFDERCRNVGAYA